MKAHFLKFAARFDALQVRERWLVVIAVLAGIVLLGHTLFVAPAQSRALVAERNLVEQQAQLAALNAQITALQSPGQDPNVSARAELESLKGQLAKQAERLAVLESALLPPHQMPALLEDMIGRKNGLRVVSLKTLPVVSALPKAASDAPQAKAEAAGAAVPTEKGGLTDGLYKHGVEIKLEGSYQELTAYLERLEQAKPKLLWGSVALSAEDHPRLVLTLLVYSLSLERAWLIV